MTKLHSHEQHFLESLSQLTYCNPFEPVRIELEKQVLGDQYLVESASAWSRTTESDRLERPNVQNITERAANLAERLRDQQASGQALRGDEASLYHDLVIYVLYYRHIALLPEGLLDPAKGDKQIKAAWRGFNDQRDYFLAPLQEKERLTLPASEHAFAVLHQVRRAFHWIFNCFIGDSVPATRLRAAVWESIFTHSLSRYLRILYSQMHNFAVLVTGPSGAGKELVAQAIGRSQYRPFDPQDETFVGKGESFLALNLPALSPSLIESELFGHRRGAFTGADTDRIGWLEQCPQHGAVFLDEIGELDATIQVKLLRVAQSRDYSRLGESKPRQFLGKLLAATNRDLAKEMHAGRFREDLYYRLCSDSVVVPSLHEQVNDQPEVLYSLIHFLAGRLLNEASECEINLISNEVHSFIKQKLPADYRWPGNIRELDQCVRSVLLRQAYSPPSTKPIAVRPQWLERAEKGNLSADELLNAYCGHVYAIQGGYEPAGRVLGLDRRTVKSRVVDNHST